MNLHKQMHVQHHNCVNSRECVRWESREALLEDVSVVVQNGQRGSIFNPMGSKASQMV